ncbi:MAG TPA: rRNA maturation RNase YbeY [Bacteroidia bacterium]|nr:rRNA maturation RNase YbeY [Bacteroidia bacterium]
MAGAPQIQFTSKGIKINPGNTRALRAWLRAVAAKHTRRIGHLIYIFVTDEFLLGMNEQYLNHKTLTDIITFDYSGDEKPANIISGEIYISIERVKENAEKFGVTKKDELNRVMAHGLLHLCGFGDKTSAEKRRMIVEEEKALALR